MCPDVLKLNPEKNQAVLKITHNAVFANPLFFSLISAVRSRNPVFCKNMFVVMKQKLLVLNQGTHIHYMSGLFAIMHSALIRKRQKVKMVSFIQKRQRN